jgi:hypothetical protein
MILSTQQQFSLARNHNAPFSYATREAYIHVTESSAHQLLFRDFVERWRRVRFGHKKEIVFVKVAGNPPYIIKRGSVL